MAEGRAGQARPGQFFGVLSAFTEAARAPVQGEAVASVAKYSAADIDFWTGDDKALLEPASGKPIRCKQTALR